MRSLALDTRTRAVVQLAYYDYTCEEGAMNYNQKYLNQKYLNESNGLLKRKNAYRGMAWLAFVILVSVLFTPFFAYPARSYGDTSYIQLLPISWFVDDAGASWLENVAEAKAFLCIATIISVAIGALKVVKVMRAYKSSEKALAVSTHKLLNYTICITGIYCLLSLFFVGAMDSFDSNVVVSFSELPFVLSIILYRRGKNIEKHSAYALNDRFFALYPKNYEAHDSLVWTMSLLFGLLSAVIFLLGCMNERGRFELVVAILFAITAAVLTSKKLKNGIALDTAMKVARKKESQAKILTKENNATNLNETTSPKPAVQQNHDGQETIESGEAQELKYFTSTGELADAFVSFARARGVDLDAWTAQKLFASLAGARAVWIKCDDKEYARSVAVMLKQFLDGADDVYTLPEGASSIGDLARMISDSSREKRGFISEIINAKANPARMSACVIQNADNDKFKEIFNPFVSYFKAPLLTNKIDLSAWMGYRGESVLMMSEGLWMIFVADASAGEIPEGIEDFSAVVEVQARPELYVDEAVEDEFPLAYRNFVDLVKGVYEDSFISLDIWKKIDKIVEGFSAMSDFKSTNPMERQIEAYSSWLISCGNDVYDVIDDMIATRYLPIVARLAPFKATDVKLSELLDKVFGIENMPKSNKVLISLGLDK